MRFGGLCQNAAHLAVICELELRFRATTGGRVAIWEIAKLKLIVPQKGVGKGGRQKGVGKRG